MIAKGNIHKQMCDYEKKQSQEKIDQTGRVMKMFFKTAYYSFKRSVQFEKILHTFLIF